MNFNEFCSYRNERADEDEFDAEKYGYIHVDDIPNIAWAKEVIHDACGAFYESGSVQDLEAALEDLCDIFDLPVPSRRPKMEPIDSNLMDWYLDYQRRHIDDQKKNTQ